MGKRNILIIEDDKMMSEALRIELEDAGYAVTVCEDGESGLKTALRGKADLIILDLVLPKMHGFDVLASIKKARDAKVRKTPIIVLTNLTQTADRERGMELGVADYCVKARMDLRSLKEKVEEMLSKT